MTDFNFHITNFPFLSSNIPSSPAYGVFISQLIRYARACSSYECFILRAMRLSNKLLGRDMSRKRLKSSLRKFYGRYGDLTKQYEVPLSRMLHDILDDDHIQWPPSLIGHYTNFWPLLISTLLPNLTFYLIVQGFHRTYATGAACQQRTLTPPDTWSCPLGTCMCSNVETNLSLTCLVSGLLNFEHPSVLLFCLVQMWYHKSRSACGVIIHVPQILAELWSLTLRIFTHFSLSSQLLLHPCMDLNGTWQGCCTASLEVHVGDNSCFTNFDRAMVLDASNFYTF